MFDLLLEGSIPKELGALSELWRLDPSKNVLAGNFTLVHVLYFICRRLPELDIRIKEWVGTIGHLVF